jgi:predicted phage tail component-like protein
MSFTFNGIKKSYVRVLAGIERPAWAPIEEEILEIPGLPGGVITSEKKKVRRLNVPIRVYKKGFASLEDVEEDLAAWLVTDEPKPLTFPHKPNRIYYAKVTGELILDDYPQWGEGVISFICPDPFKYSNTIKTIDFASDLENIHNLGSVKTYPIFTANVNQSITHLDIVAENGYMRIGQPYEADTTPFQPETIILSDSMGTLVGWGEATSVDNGYVAGSIQTDGAAFYPESFGAVIEPKMFQGPSLKRSLSENVQDFRMDALIELKNLSGQTGILEIYLLDAANSVVGKIGVQDRYNATAETRAFARAGDNATGIFFANETARIREYWQDFDGILRIERIGNEWKAYFAVIKDGRHIHMRGSDGSLYYLDVDQKYMAQVAQVQVAFRIWPNSTPVPMKIKDIKIWRINQRTENRIPYIAHAGDVIEFNHQTNDIRINGESRIDLKDFGASYFPLEKGENIIQYGPADAVDLTIEWRERFN